MKTHDGRVAVIGAGPAGLAAAHHLTRHGRYVDVFEASASVGGLARSVMRWGHSVDLGPHLFNGGDEEALELWTRLTGEDAEVLPFRRGILTSYGLLEYPMQPLDLLRKLPLQKLGAMGAGLLGARLRARPDVSVTTEAWVVERYGRAMYDTLLRAYVEKLWGTSGQEVDSAFARALFGISARVAFTGDTRRRQVPAGQTFLYPRAGSSAVWERMASGIRRHGAIHTGSRVGAIAIRDGRVDGLLVDGAHRSFAHVISTIPLSRLVTILPGVPSAVRGAIAELRARHVVIVHLLLRNAPRTPHLWLYVYDPRLRVGRVSDHRSWHPALPDDADAIITMEYWCGDADPLWSGTDASAINLARAEIAALPLYATAQAIDGEVTRLRHAHPQPSVGYTRTLDTVRSFVAGFRGLESIGRHGSFTSGSMADVMGDGLGAAERVLSLGADV